MLSLTCDGRLYESAAQSIAFGAAAIEHCSPCQIGKLSQYHGVRQKYPIVSNTSRSTEPTRSRAPVSRFQYARTATFSSVPGRLTSGFEHFLLFVHGSTRSDSKNGALNRCASSANALGASTCSTMMPEEMLIIR